MEVQSLQGKVAFITGGGTGIGSGIALSFAEAGATVAVFGRRVEPLERVVKAIEAAGGRAVAISGDVTSLEDLEGAVSRISSEFGRLDIAVANAGGPPMQGPVLETSPEEWRRVIDLNLTGSWNTARATVPIILASGGGHLLFIVSSAGRERSGELVGAYGASKAGVSQLARVLAMELDRQIAVNTLSPGLVESEILGVFDGQVPEMLVDAAQEMGEWLKAPDEIGRLATYIVGLPPAGTTGQLFALDRNR